MEDTPLSKPPKSECSDIWTRPQYKWPVTWQNIEEPVVPLQRDLYGHAQAEQLGIQLEWPLRNCGCCPARKGSRGAGGLLSHVPAGQLRQSCHLLSAYFTKSALDTSARSRATLLFLVQDGKRGRGGRGQRGGGVWEGSGSYLSAAGRSDDGKPQDRFPQLQGGRPALGPLRLSKTRNAPLWAAFLVGMAPFWEGQGFEVSMRELNCEPLSWFGSPLFWGVKKTSKCEHTKIK